MGRIEEALKRAGVTPSAANLTEATRAPHRVNARVDDYPGERDDASRGVVQDYPRELENRAGSAPVESSPSRRSIASGGLTGTAPKGISQVDPAVQGKLVTDPETAAASLEQYRRLAATLHQIRNDRPFKVLMVSSAVPREGKTLTSVNLALTFSESYKQRVLLIDADLRRPSVHAVFRIPNKKGLGDGLTSDRTSLQTVQVTPHLTVLPAGSPDRDPIAGLTSERMKAILVEAAEHFDWVIVDTPPVGLISDARLLAALADGVILVAGAGSTSYELIQHAIEEIGRDRIVGAVLNRVEPDIIAPSGYYNYYYGEPVQS